MAVIKSCQSILLVALASIFLVACEGAQSEKDMIAEAQYCLDDATDAPSADTCLSKISGLDTSEANTLRCAGGFIAAGITSSSSLSTALNAIKDGDSTTALLSALSFPNVQLVNETVESCNKSGRDGLRLIGAMAKSATTIASLANLASCSDPDDLSSCDTSVFAASIASILASPGSADSQEAFLQIASSIQTVFSTTCTSESSSEDICGQISGAASTSGIDIETASDAELKQLGEALLNEWQG